ncbi:MAG: c-type cytochrome, partial [Acidobacteriaceae bacterium]|nr:c-type cytochrome [Acidobacteriaceae bacterium]
MSDEMIIKTGEGKLVDEVYESPVDRWQHRVRGLVMLIVLAVIALIVIYLLWYFVSDHTREYSDIQEHFKYGSIGSEPGGTVLTPVGGVLPPYLVFKTLPKVCPDKLPGGYASLGLVFEPNHDMPIGVSRRWRLGVEQVGLNCAVCHTGTVRETPNSQPMIVLGMPAHQLDLERFFNFVISCSLDDRLTATNVIQKAEDMGEHVSLMQKLILSTALIQRLKLQTLEQQNRMGFALNPPIPPWGRGRVDTFNPYKSLQFNWNLRALPQSELIGASDFPSLWNQRPREGMHLHWDGNNTSVDERNLSASLGAGVTPVTVDHASLQRIHDWIWTLAPPRYPFAIDQSRSARGKAIFDQQCAECHSFGGGKTGTVENLASINTDPYRLNSYTYIFCVNQAALYPESRYRFTHFSKTDGYANQPLDGIWARAPYLHNGSVPTLLDLLQDPASRPKQFVRGYDVYNQEKVGFVYDTPEA